MITFRPDDFEQMLPEIRAEIERTRQTSGSAVDRFFILSAEEYAMLRGRKVVELDEAPVEFLDEMLAQLDAAIARGDAAEKVG